MRKPKAVYLLVVSRTYATVLTVEQRSVIANCTDGERHSSGRLDNIGLIYLTTHRKIEPGSFEAVTMCVLNQVLTQCAFQSSPSVGTPAIS